MYQSYLYDAWGKAVPTPRPYLPAKRILGENLGIGELLEPQDMFVASDNTLYIVDSGNNRIIKTDDDFNLISIYTEFEHDGIIDKFNNPYGIFVTDAGDMFIADRDNERIVHLDMDGNYIKEITSPESDMPGAFPEYFRFRPNKIAVDQVGRMYVIVEGLYEGLLQLDINGNFRTFMGAPKVSVNPWLYFWYSIASDEQKQRSRLTLPTEYSSMHLNDLGFIFTTVSGGEIQVDQVIRKLNPTGKDVLKRNGTHPPMGDLYSGFSSQVSGFSLLVDVVARESDTYSVLDSRRGRVFTYDGKGNLLYVFGGIGQGVGLFVRPVALEAFGNKLLVLDSANNSITVFEPTDYALLIHRAINEYNQGNYEESSDTWFEVLKLNANNELAYSGVGEAYLRQTDYAEAMHYYKLGNNRTGYSDAFYRYRQQLIGEKFGLIMNSLLLIVVFVFVIQRYHLVKRLRDSLRKSWMAEVVTQDKFQNNRLVAWLKHTFEAFKYSFHIIFHPFDGFWDLKHEHKGTPGAATIIFAIVIFSNVFRRQYTGFVFNYNKPSELNILMEMVSIAIPFLLWCIVNWALTTLMDGKGTIKDIYIAGCYALTPIYLINIPITIASNYITIQEGTFYYLLAIVSMVWALSLLFLGSGVTHDYSMGKTVLTTVATIVGIGVVIFVCILFFDVIDQVYRFAREIYLEMSFRL